MRIILARHGDAQGTTGKFHGATDDSLTTEGRTEAYSLARELKQYKPEFIYSSPVERCKETAKILAKELHIPMKVKQELNCLNMGSLTGKDSKKFLETARYYLNNPSDSFPNGESVNDFAKRYLPFFETYYKNKSNSSIIFLTHGRNILISKAYIKSGKLAPAFEKSILTDNKETTSHGGYAIADKGSFKLVDSERVPAGRS